MRYKNTSVFTDIQLSEPGVVPKEVQVLRVGKFNHPKYGVFEITSQTLAEMKANFDKKVRGIDTAFDYFHDSDKEASAWVNDLLLKENGTELWAHVAWTPKAEKKLAERELRYFSPDFAFQWKDPESGTTHKNVLFGGGLTNRPFVKEMKAIVANEQGEEMNLDQALARVKEVEAQNLKLSEDVAAKEKELTDMQPKASKAEELEKQIAALQAELAKVKESEGALMTEKKKLEEQAQLAEKEKEFNVLLTEGKACAAQKDAWMKGDMKAFVQLAEKVNLNGSGHTHDNDGKTGDVIKLAEEKMKANPKLSKGEAIEMVLKEQSK